MPERFLTKKEAAEYLGISEDEVEKLVTQGKLPAYKIGDTFLRFKHEHVAALRTRIFSSTSGAMQENNFLEKIVDFFYFSDFYIISLLIIMALAIIIIFF